MYSFREMNINDYEDAFSLWTSTEGMGIGGSDTKDAISQFLKRNPGHSFVCVDVDGLVGTILCGHDGRRAFIYHLSVSSTHRNRGIGKSLVKIALERLKSEGIVKCHLMVYVDNELGNQFWVKSEWDKRNDILIYSKNT
jgi:ribosomal protein S18 acetylase RimI-like enzyme